MIISIEEQYKYKHINNRRYDDVVVVIRHEYKSKNKNKHKILIEYFNEYAELFFGFKISPDIDALFDSILDKRTKSNISNNLKGLDIESNDLYENFDAKYDLGTIVRKINFFTMIDRNNHNTLINIRIFPLESKIDFNKTIVNTYYYLVIRSIEPEIQFSNFRNKFLEEHGVKSGIDKQYNTATLASAINELKVLTEFKKQYPHILICVGRIIIQKSFESDVLLKSTIVDLFQRNTRGSDLIDVIDNSALLIAFFNYGRPDNANDNICKITERLSRLIKLNQYIFDAYHNQSHNLFKIELFNLEEGESYEKYK